MVGEVRPLTSIGHLEACAAMATCLNTAELLPTIAGRVAEALGLPICVVALREGELLEPKAVAGLEEGEALSPLGVGEGPWAKAVEEGAPVSLEVERMPPDWSRAFKGRGGKFVAVSPLSGRAGVVGVVIAAKEEPFGQVDLETLLNLCRVGGAALDNARLYEEQIRRNIELQTLAAVGRALTATLEVDELLSRILAVAVDLIGAEAGYLLTVTEHGQLVLKASRGLSPKVVEEAAHLLGEGIPKWVATYGRPALVADVESDPRYVPLPGREVHTLLCVPLRVKGRTMGVVCLENKIGGGPFTQDDLNLMTALSGQASLALENAELYRRLEERLDEIDKALIKVNQELAEKSAQVEAILRSIPDGVIVTDAQNRVILMNPAAERMLGIRSEEAGENPLLAIMGRERAEELYRRAINEGRASADVSLAKAEGRMVLRANMASVRDERGRLLGIVTVLSDITHLKELDEIKTDLISFVSHELKTPLTAIKGFASTLLRMPDLEEERRREFLQLIDVEADRLARLALDLLDISRIESGRPLEVHLEEVDLGEIVDRVIESQRMFAKGHEFEVEIKPGAERIVADPDKLEQILVNLVNNAIKYSPKGGRVRVAAERRGREVWISVSDQGIGIRPEELPHLFQRYRRLRDGRGRVKGTGIGLYLVRHLVEAHGGRIWVESEYGKGSTFTFALPQPEGEGRG